VFGDAAGRMNLSLSDTGLGLLLVPQFTLAADTAKGLRPGFSRAALPADAERLFGYMAKRAEKRLPGAQTGRFGAHMRVSLVNDGPVTFWIRAAPHEAPE
jgi:D-tyrosyl-tRNA(Tyr) deacylase